jgi:hypothetical protein
LKDAPAGAIDAGFGAATMHRITKAADFSYIRYPTPDPTVKRIVGG